MLRGRGGFKTFSRKKFHGAIGVFFLNKRNNPATIWLIKRRKLNEVSSSLNSNNNNNNGKRVWYPIIGKQTGTIWNRFVLGALCKHSHVINSRLVENCLWSDGSAARPLAIRFGLSMSYYIHHESSNRNYLQFSFASRKATVKYRCWVDSRSFCSVV